LIRHSAKPSSTVADYTADSQSAQDINMRFLSVDDSSTMRRMMINTLNKRWRLRCGTTLQIVA